MTHPSPEHHRVIIIGGGQAGLSLSHYLKQRSIDHLVLEKHEPLHAWRTQRWDSFCLVTPNWQCKLPGWEYSGPEPHGFMVKQQIIDYLEGFVRQVNPPMHTGVTVQRVVPSARGGFEISTSAGSYTAEQVVVASGGYHQPIIPRLAERLPRDIVQVHSEQYRNPQSLPPGKVLVVGNGQSGAQLAEDLHLAGREVILATGDAPRCARFYRGRDVVDWLADMGYYDMPVHEHPLREGVRDNTNHFVTGRDGGRDIDLRQFAKEGMQLYGLLTGLIGRRAAIRPRPAQQPRPRRQDLQRHQRGHRPPHRGQGHRGAARLGLHPGVGARRGTHHAEPARGRHLGHRVVHRLPARFRLARRPGVQWPRTPGPCAGRDGRAGPVFHRPALAATPGVRAASRAWRGMRSTWPSRSRPAAAGAARATRRNWPRACCPEPQAQRRPPQIRTSAGRHRACMAAGRDAVVTPRGAAP